MPLRVFPVAGGASYSDDWADPRSGGRSHAGNDLFSNEGVPLLAVDDGDVRFGSDPLGGNIANLRSPDGTRYYYAHLVRFQGTNRFARAGEIIGYMGRTGNAANTPVHLHFEVHPGGGAAVNPFPLLQRAPIRAAGGAVASSRSLILPLAFAGAVGLGVYAYLNPGSTRSTLRRWGLG